MILMRIIERITIDNQYRIKIFFTFALDDFKEAAESSATDGYTVIVEDSELVAKNLAV